MRKYPKYTKENLEKWCAESDSISEVLEKAGRKRTSGGGHQTLSRKIAEYDIDITHFSGQRWNKGKTMKMDSRIAKGAINLHKYSKEEMFCKNSPATRRMIRDYVLHYNLIPYKCCVCGCDGSWMGHTISLQLHHKDGDPHNNELSNLEYRCPNCHAMTDNYCRKKSKTNKPPVPDSELLRAIKNNKTVGQALKSVGLTTGATNYDRARRLEKEQVKQKEKHTNHCIDCGKKISNKATRCKNCSNKFRTMPLSKMVISRTELKDKIRTMPFTQIAKEFHVSDNAIRKWCIKYGLPSKASEIKQYTDSEWETI